MSGWKGRALPVAVAVCLMLCQSVYALAVPTEEAALQSSGQYSEPDARETHFPADSGVEKPTEPEAPAEPDQKSQEEPVEPDNFLRSQSNAALESPDVPEESGTANSEEMLAEWIEQHQETGGTVSLSDHVTITRDMGIYGIVGEITIDTGMFGLVFDGGMLPTYNVFITGEGVNVPVVNVQRGDGGYPYDPSWNNTLLQMNVTATGRNGRGGTALRISNADDKDFDMDSLLWQGVLRAYGEGAVGLWMDVPMEAWCYKVEISGENSAAVYAPNGADLFYCKLTAEGDGAVAAAGKNLSLDSCAMSPAPSGVQSVNRRAMEESFSRLYLPLEQYGSLFGTIEMLNKSNVFLIDEEGGVISRPFPVYWDENYEIDTGNLGTTLLHGAVDPDMYGLGIFDDVPITLTVEVRDPALPCISRIAVREMENGARYAVLNFWEDYDPMEEGVILWRSDDEGETWQNATHAQDVLWNGSSVNFTYDTLEHSVWFQLEVTGVGESNIAILDERDGVFIGGNGGDRTGTDRGGVNPPNGGNGGSDDGGGNGNVPGSGEESDGGDGGQSGGGNDNLPKTDEASNGHNESATEVSGLISSRSDAHTDTVIPTGTASLDTETVSAGNPTAATPAQPVPAEEQTEALQTQPVPMETERDTDPAEEEEAPAIGDAESSFDPEQSAPELGFSAKALTVFFLASASLCFGALMVFRFGRLGRWRREDP
ncbi:hypothetical protein [Oscillibacter sp.]|uniref:hypothetical protein n=1 Tax=Oscillibacter sp. TaxID=1945593 RepID=UPI00289E75EE|nr:hypothetical protein [Oscillibacter sp.]